MVNFPTTLDTLTNPLSTDTMVAVSHSSQHANVNDAIEALEAKVGVDNSAVTTSLDYKLKSTSSVSPGHKHNATDIADGSVSNAEFQYLDGVTSSIQAQLNSKGAGTVTEVSSANADIGVATGTTTPVLTLNSSTPSSASTIVKRDANGNTFSNNYFAATASTVSAAGTTVLTVGSARTQNLTGSSTQTFQLPDATTCSLSSIFEFNNNSSSSLIVTNNGASTLYTIPAGGAVICFCTSIATANGSWDFHALAPSSVTWGSGITGLVMNSALSTTPIIAAGASSSTVPSFIPQRGASTTGFGGDGTNLYATIAGTAKLTINSTGITAINTTNTDVYIETTGATGGSRATLNLKTPTRTSEFGLRATTATQNPDNIYIYTGGGYKMLMDASTGATTFASTITSGEASGTTGALKLNGTTSGVVTLSTADAAGTWTMKLPTTAGTNTYFLQTDGSGNTTWAAASGGISWGTSISAGSGVGLTMTSSDLSGANAFQSSVHTASGTLTACTTTQNTYSTSRTYTLTSGSVTDNFIGTLFSRTNVTTGAGGTLLAQGPVVRIAGTDTQTAGTLTPSYDLLALAPSLRSTGSSINVSVPNSVVTAPTNGHIYAVLGNTQTVPQNMINIDMGTSVDIGHTGIFVKNIGGNFAGADAGIAINSFSSATQAVSAFNTSVGLKIGYNFNTSSTQVSIGALFTNQNNVSSGNNSGLVINNASTKSITVGTTASGQGFHIYQSGAGGTSQSIYGGNNVNTSTNGLVNYTLSNIQSAATVVQKIALGSSAQAHNGIQIIGSNAISTAVAFNADMTTGYTGKLFRGAVNSVEKFVVNADGSIVTTPLISAAVGYLNIPQNSKSAAYTTVEADAGKHIYHPSADTTARTFTIDSNANVAYPIGTAITIVNDISAGVITIAITSDTLLWEKTGATGSRTLAANSIATLLKITSTKWIISGTTGLT